MTKPIAQRIFTAGDQEAFAELTGDRNPMHMDEAAARRTQAGACVVHGMHAMLWMLEQSSGACVDLNSLARISVRFAKFILVGQTVSVWFAAKDYKSAKLEARVNDQAVIVMMLGFDSGAADAPTLALPISSATQPVPSRPFEPAFEAMDSLSGRLVLPAESDPLRLFPALCGTLSAAWVGSMGLLSTVVGMIVPGLHSIFSSLSVVLCEDFAHSATVAFHPEQIDERFRRVTISVEGAGFTGEIAAFMRFPPIQSPKMDLVAARMAPDVFKDRTALVIGGSRGIGANIAKLIAAGGGKVVITYVVSRVEAESIETEINAYCKQAVCWASRYDVLADDDLPNLGALERFTHVYYCATTKIAGQRANVYEQGKFIEFCKVYVDGLNTLAHALLKGRPVDHSLTVLYPSSIFVTERPSQMTEYAMAKAAGEILCADLAKAYRNLKISMPRLPRILTDQTATVPPVPTEDAIEVLLPLLLAE